jgi:hypothetical protein
VEYFVMRPAFWVLPVHPIAQPFCNSSCLIENQPNDPSKLNGRGIALKMNQLQAATI